MENKTELLTVIIIILLIIIAGGGAYFLADTKTEEPKDATETNKTTPKENWSTFTSDKGFEISYPNTWILETTPNSTLGYYITLISPETKERQDYVKEEYEKSGKALYAHEANIHISYFPSIADSITNKGQDFQATTIEELIEKDEMRTKIGSINIGEVEGVNLVTGGLGAYYTIMVENNSHLYEILFNQRDQENQLTDTEKEILSTLKFTK